MKTRIVLLLWLVCFAAFAQEPGQSPEVKRLEEQRKALLSEIETTRKLLDENQRTTGNANTRLVLLRDQIKTRLGVIDLLDQEVSQLDRNISAKGMQINRLEKELEKKKLDYSETVEYMYMKRNNQSKLLFILSADDFAQAVRRFVYLREYSASHKTKADEIAAKQSEVAAQRKELEKQKGSKVSLLDDRRKEEQALEVEESALAGEVNILQSEQKKIKTNLAKKQKEEETISREIQRVIAEEIARAEEAARKAAEEEARKNSQAAQAQTKEGETPKPKQGQQTAFSMTKEDSKLSANFADNKGKISFPLKGSYKIVNRFGKHSGNTSPLFDYKGIDIVTLQGTDAISVFDGEVIFIGEIQGYCRYILLRHGKYYTFYQNLDKVYVKKGDKVIRGQALGRIYTDVTKGEGTILHFEIHESKTPLNPELWLKR